MKNLKFLFFPLFVGFSFFIGFCVKPETDLKQEDLAKLQVQTDVGLTIGKTDKGNVYVLLDGVDNNYCVLQTEAVSTLFGNKSLHAIIKRSDDYIFIKTDAGENILLQTPKAQIPKELLSLTFVFKVTGFGFIQMKNDRLYERAKNDIQSSLNVRTIGGSYIISDPVEDAICKCRVSGLESEKDCSAGGWGSRSCSRGSGSSACSVSCDLGYFSCCKD